MKEKMCSFIIKHSPTSNRRSQQPQMRPVDPRLMPFVRRRVTPHHLAEARPGPHFLFHLPAFPNSIRNLLLLLSSDWIHICIVHFLLRNLFWKYYGIHVPVKKMKMNLLGSGDLHFSTCRLFSFCWFSLSWSPAHWFISCTSCHTSLILILLPKVRGAALAQYVMPVGNNSRLHMLLIGIVQADIWSALHVMFSMMDPHASTWWPQIEWACPPPCCKSSRWLDENTVQLLITLIT